METYRENATCPKCLGGDVSVVWCAWCMEGKREGYMAYYC